MDNVIDIEAAAVRSSWNTHAAAIASGDESAMTTAYRAVLMAERALEASSAKGAKTAAQRANYAATIAAYDSQIEDLDRAAA